MKTKVLRSAFLGLLLGLIAVQTAEAGLLKRFIYGDFNGTAVTNLFGTNNFGVVVFPNSPTVTELIPADSTYGPFYAETVSGTADLYGSWIPGYVEPPETGNYFSAATSAVVHVTVSQDVVKPVALTAGSLLKQVVRVRYDEPVNTNDATTLANYSLKSAAGATIPILSAAMDTNNPTMIVLLQTGPMTEYGTNTITVQNVRDVAETPNMMDPNTLAFVSYNFEVAARIANSQAWAAYAEGTNITITAGGSDIWGNSDQMVYAYKTLTGNFDLKFRGVSLTLANSWSKMGIMARASTNANSRNVYCGSTPPSGQNTGSSGKFWSGVRISLGFAV